MTSTIPFGRHCLCLLTCLPSPPIHSNLFSRSLSSAAPFLNASTQVPRYPTQPAALRCVAGCPCAGVVFCFVLKTDDPLDVCIKAEYGGALNVNIEWVSYFRIAPVSETEYIMYVFFSQHGSISSRNSFFWVHALPVQLGLGLHTKNKIPVFSRRTHFQLVFFSNIFLKLKSTLLFSTLFFPF